jgi:protease-4
MGLFRRSKKRVVIVKVEGIIADNDSLGAGRAKVVAALKEAQRKKARAVVLRVNSPGGTVAACQEIFDSVVRLKEKGIPVVASMGDVAASGGVYISMAATEIVANSGTVTGSIGVIIRSSDLSNLYEKVGVSQKVIKSGPHKDMLSTYRSFSKDEERLLQGVIDDSHRQFVEVIAAARQKASQEIEEIADGRILTGRQAHKAGLIDHLGDLDLAVDRASSLAGIEGEPNLVSIQIRKGLLQKLFGPFSRLGQKSAIGESLSGIPLWILPTHP